MLKPEQAQDLVDHFGSERAAARVIGMSRSGLRYWLDPIPGRARAKRWGANNRSAQKNYNAYYRNTAAGKAAQGRYQSSLKGQITRVRSEQNRISNRTEGHLAPRED